MESEKVIEEVEAVKVESQETDPPSIFENYVEPKDLDDLFGEKESTNQPAPTLDNLFGDEGVVRKPPTREDIFGPRESYQTLETTDHYHSRPDITIEIYDLTSFLLTVTLGFMFGIAAYYIRQRASILLREYKKTK